jgi:hypothetical protein
LNDVKVTNSFGLAVTIWVLAGIVSFFYFGWPQRQNAVRSSAAHAAAKPMALSAARLDPPKEFPNSKGITVGSADAVVSDGLAYSFDGSDAQGGLDGDNWLLACPADS